jgi:hypothetical protein
MIPAVVIKCFGEQSFVREPEKEHLLLLGPHIARIGLRGEETLGFLIGEIALEMEPLLHPVLQGIHFLKQFFLALLQLLAVNPPGK